MSDYFEVLELARSQLRVMSELLRHVEMGLSEPIGANEAGLYADWCDAVAQVLATL